MDELISLKKFNTIEEASEVAELLERNDIFLKVEREKLSEDLSFAGNTHESQINIKIKTTDVINAQSLLNDLEIVHIDKLDTDYYLFDFEDHELFEILQKPDDWSFNDYHWALEILRRRGKEPGKAQLEEWKKDRLKLLAQPEEISSAQIKLSYFFCLLGGIIGILMGRHICSFKKTLPNGQKVFFHTEDSRKKGTSIVIFGSICLLAETLLILLFIAI